MKFFAVASLVAALTGVAQATPVDITERQGAAFPAACNSACASFIPMYNACSGAADINACLKDQGLCANPWRELPACLTCWSVETGVPNLQYWIYFVGLCTA